VTELLIRTFEARDIDSVWALHREGLQQTTPEYPEVVAHYESDLRGMEGHYLVDGSHFWVAELDGALVGMTGIERADAETGRLRRMRATTDRRRSGIAQALLETAERFCRDQGYRRLVLDTTEHQTAAHRLYEKNGFVRTGERSLGPFRVFDYAKELG
jgi:GNAT superfamily N-acetyltransferase